MYLTSRSTTTTIYLPSQIQAFVLFFFPFPFFFFPCSIQRFQNPANHPNPTEKATESLKSTIGLNAKQAEGSAKEMSGETKGKASELAGEAKGKTQEVAGEAKGKTQEVAGQVKGKAEEVKGKL